MARVLHERTAGPPSVTGHGYGFGTLRRQAECAARLGKADGPSFDEEVWVAERGMDDMEPGDPRAVADRIRAAGALDPDVYTIQMKKGRPGIRTGTASVCRALGSGRPGPQGNDHIRREVAGLSSGES